VRASIEKLLSAAGLLQYISVIVGNDEGIASKPSPDLYLEGANRLGVSIHTCVIVEDSPVGLQAAIAANPRRVVAVKDPSYVNMSLLSKILGE
jgi:HAD superfamily hydrolase (TIGR01509 family)